MNKNVHLISTNKLSRLHITTIHYGEYDHINSEFNKYKHKFLLYPKHKGSGKNIFAINIYITSDEVIKDVRPHKGKWQLEKGNILNQFPTYLTDLSECKLVIMTTDQDLIKDGVQAIDNDFLKWFVKNPSCKYVDVKYQYWKEINNIGKYTYQIIIPQEEPKQEELKFPLIIENGLEYFKLTSKLFNYGVEYQQEKSYSEEEVLLLLHKRDKHNLDNPNVFNGWQIPKQWFEQFKKK